MATAIIKSGASDNQALVDGTGHLLVTASGGGGGAVSANITEIGGAPIALGQSTMAGSLPVVIASDQTPIAVTGTISASNPSVGVTGTTAPTSATEMGGVSSGGLLVPLSISAAGVLNVSTSGSAVVSGTVNSNILGLNVFQTSQYSIGTSATQLTPTPLTNRSSMSVKATCSGTNAVYIGNNIAVTSTTGFALFNGDVVNLDLTGASVIYAIASSGIQTLYILELAE